MPTGQTAQHGEDSQAQVVGGERRLPPSQPESLAVTGRHVLWVGEGLGGHLCPLSCSPQPPETPREKNITGDTFFLHPGFLFVEAVGLVSKEEPPPIPKILSSISRNSRVQSWVLQCLQSQLKASKVEIHTNMVRKQ